VEIEDLLNAMDRTAANLAKLEKVWERAHPFIPTGPARGSDPEYDDLRRAWADLLKGLPQIDGWTITEPLPDIDSLGQAFIDYADIMEPPWAAYEAGEQPGKDLAEYRYRLNRARRRAARERVGQLVATISSTLPGLLSPTMLRGISPPCTLRASSAGLQWLSAVPNGHEPKVTTRHQRPSFRR
jgi:hypothetical protein